MTLKELIHLSRLPTKQAPGCGRRHLRKTGKQDKLDELLKVYYKILSVKVAATGCWI